MKENLTTIETDAAALELWRAMAADGVDVPLGIPTNGDSMKPLTHRIGDSIRVVPLRRELLLGDFIVFHRDDGKFVAHRVCWFDEETVQTLGDNCVCRDRAVSRSEILGLVSHVQRGKRLIYVDTPAWRFYGRMKIFFMPARAFWRLKVMRPVKQLVKKILGIKR